MVLGEEFLETMIGGNEHEVGRLDPSSQVVHDFSHPLLRDELRPDLLVEGGQSIVVVMPQVIADRINQDIDIAQVVLAVTQLGEGLARLGIGDEPDLPVAFVLGDAQCASRQDPFIFGRIARKVLPVFAESRGEQAPTRTSVLLGSRLK